MAVMSRPHLPMCHRRLHRLSHTLETPSLGGASDHARDRIGHDLGLDCDLAQQLRRWLLVADEEQARMRDARPVARTALVVQHARHGDDILQRGAVAGGQHHGVEFAGVAVREGGAVSVKRATAGLTAMSPRLTAAIVPTSMSGTRWRRLNAVSGPSAGRASP